MDRLLNWLPEAADTVWAPLGDAMLAGLPVPAGFIVAPSIEEATIRQAYEELKIREKTHFVAVRGRTHAALNVIGPDTLIHTVRRFWAEAPDSCLLIQRM